MESPETDPQLCQFAFNVTNKAIQWGKGHSLQQLLLKQLDVQVEKQLILTVPHARLLD